MVRRGADRVRDFFRKQPPPAENADANLRGGSYAVSLPVEEEDQEEEYVEEEGDRWHILTLECVARMYEACYIFFRKGKWLGGDVFRSALTRCASYADRSHYPESDELIWIDSERCRRLLKRAYPNRLNPEVDTTIPHFNYVLSSAALETKPLDEFDWNSDLLEEFLTETFSPTCPAPGMYMYEGGFGEYTVGSTFLSMLASRLACVDRTSQIRYMASDSNIRLGSDFARWLLRTDRRGPGITLRL